MSPKISSFSLHLAIWLGHAWPFPPRPAKHHRLRSSISTTKLHHHLHPLKLLYLLSMQGSSHRISYNCDEVSSKSSFVVTIAIDGGGSYALPLYLTHSRSLVSHSSRPSVAKIFGFSFVTTISSKGQRQVLLFPVIRPSLSSSLHSLNLTLISFSKP
ncbi:hypothetical protein VNO77_19930 [Canavalia gladiata]|uniref:Uncharacterized protein n=1 Tax=Canavalia gladiata TaxID=3824 RepID=A0AAN9QQ24_CANGL